MTPRRSIWRAASRVLLGYQALIAAAITAFGVWIASGASGCRPDCGVGGAFLGILGFVWMAQAVVAGVAVVILFALTTNWASRGAVVANIIVEGLLLLPAIRFLEVMGPFGVPGPGKYAIGVAIGAAVVIVALSILELFASDRWLTSHRSIAVVCLVVIPFAAASLPGLASAYSSAQIGSDGFPVGPVTAQFVRDHGSKLPLGYPGSNLTYTRASAESKTFNRYRMASWEERLAKNGLRANAEAWYQSSLRDAGWLRLCNAGGCQKDVEMVFFRGSRECVTVLVTNDGVGEIVVDYQITPSQKPLSGDPTADLRYCTGQY
jgi:hypothetical protein